MFTSHLSTRLRSELRRGFTLIELIIVVAIIAIIAAAVFTALDPAKRLHASRNGRRWSDVTAVLGAIKTYQTDNGGSLPSSIDTASGSVQFLGTSVGTCGSLTCVGQTVVSSSCGADFTSTLRPYLKSIPTDPSTGNASNTRYYVNQDAYGIVSVGACDAEGESSGGGGTAPTVQVTQ